MPGTGIPLDRAAVLSTSLEAVLYGISLAMFGATLGVLLRRRVRTGSLNKPLVGAGVCFFALSTVHICVDIHRLMRGLIDERTSVGGPAAWFALAAEQTFVFKNAVYIVQTVLWDSVVVYRCHAVWADARVTAFLLVLLCSIVVTGIGCVYADSVAWQDVGGLFHTLLAYRLWRADRRSRRAGASAQGLLRPALLAVIDAGALYFAVLLAALVCFVLRSNAQYVVLDMITPTIAIAFYLVILRVALASAADSDGAVTCPIALKIRVEHMTTTMRDGSMSQIEGSEGGTGKGAADENAEGKAEGLRVNVAEGRLNTNES
ncbi:hypothetical protein K488DRAFT_70471 [Vararia minispora EC-137]|uniref:Uncharacterized protein n=1 Tax=Vararia minispora EC-137 TaxID=1314806 RepID=A0ACB8QLT9_9AGAM|nr:hypothetical protein K488DRAFT_70471 [Vararia minispora EC-137]